MHEWAAKEKVEVTDRLHHVAGLQEPADHRGRSAGPVRPRHPRDADLVAAGPRRAARAGRRHHGAADQAERRRERHRRISRQAPTDSWLAVPATHRQPDQGTVLAHRPDEAACRHRHPGDVSGRRRRRRPTSWTIGRLPEGRGSLPQGRRPVRHRPRPDVRLGRYRGRVLPRVRRRTSSTPRAISRSSPTRCGRRSNTSVKARAVLCRRTRRHGTTPPTTSGWCRARAR